MLMALVKAGQSQHTREAGATAGVQTEAAVEAEAHTAVAAEVSVVVGVAAEEADSSAAAASEAQAEIPRALPGGLEPAPLKHLRTLLLHHH